MPTLFRSFSGLVVSAFVFAALSSCSTMVKVPETKAVTTEEANKAWAQVLRDYVNDAGEVDFEGLMKNQGQLRTYVAYVSNHGPKSTPNEYTSKEQKMAFWINSYNALSMYNVLEKGIPKTNAGFKKVGFFYFTKFKIDGEDQSLYTYENELIRKQGEPRIHFALNCMAVSCPRLPKVPFTAEKLEADLEREAKEFFGEERNLSINEGKKTVHFSEILDFFPEDFLAKAPSLIAYANKYAPRQIPSDYKVKFTDYDWTINSSNRKK